MNDSLEVRFMYEGNTVHPLHVDEVQANCSNRCADCDFALNVLGNSTGT